MLLYMVCVGLHRFSTKKRNNKWNGIYLGNYGIKQHKD